MKIVMVEWVDSCGHGGWHRSASMDYEPVNCTSVGIVMVEDDRKIVLALNHTADSEIDVSDVMSIPMCSVKEITVLREE